MGMAPSNEIIWRPTEEYLSGSNVRPWFHSSLARFTARG